MITNEQEFLNEQEFINEEEVTSEELTEKEENVEYFTDEMHRNLFLFQEPMKLGGKAVTGTVKLTMKKNQ